MSDVSTLISLFSAGLSLIAIAVSVKSHTLNHDAEAYRNENQSIDAAKIDRPLSGGEQSQRPRS